MFDLSVEKIVERLPAAEWLGKTIRQAKGFAAAASQQIQAEVGPELDQLRTPLAELRAPFQELRALRDPRGAVMRHLLSDPVGGAAMGEVASPRTPPIDLDAT